MQYILIRILIYVEMGMGMGTGIGIGLGLGIGIGMRIGKRIVECLLLISCFGREGVEPRGERGRAEPRRQRGIEREREGEQSRDVRA